MWWCGRPEADPVPEGGYRTPAWRALIQEPCQFSAYTPTLPQNDIPRAADNVFVEEHASGLYMLTFTGPNGRVIRVIAEEIASTYVAYEHLFTQFEPTAIQGIAVDPRYVSLATKFWPEGIRMTFSGAEKPVLVQSIGRTESMLIMPKKVPN